MVTRVEASEYDTVYSYLRRIAVSIPQTLPEHLRIEEEVTILRTGDEIHIQSINEYLKTLDAIDIPKKIDEIKKTWPQVQEKSIPELWLLYHPGKENELHKANFFDHYDVVKIQKSIKDKRDELVEIVAEHDRIVATLRDTKREKTIDTSEFTPDEIILGIHFELPNEDKLIDVFDSLKVSRIVPFIKLVYNNSTYYKVHTSITSVLVQEWIDEEQIEDTIVVRVLRVTGSRVTKTSNLYTLGIWSKDNVLGLRLSLDAAEDQKTLEDRIVSMIDEKMIYTIKTREQLEIHGTITVGVHINRYAMCDMITSDKIVSYFLYVNERKKLATSKKRFYVYYNYTNEINQDPVTLMVTTYEDRSDIRIMKAKNEEQVNQLLRIFGSIMSYYAVNEEKVFNVYRNLFPKFDRIAEIVKRVDVKPKQITKERTSVDIKKAGGRIIQLREKRPDIFVNGYSRLCQGISQPKIVSEEVATTYVPNMKMYYPKENGNWYVCAPREEYDTAQNRLYPGLAYNETLLNKTEFPFLPCCFIADQYSKANSPLNVYLGVAKKKEEATIGLGHVLSEDKSAPSGRYAEMPQFVSKLIGNSGMDEKICKRRGVVRSPNSVLHCLELALQTDAYTEYETDDGKEAYIQKDVRTELLSQIEPSVAKQEMYNYDIEDIITYMKDVASFLDPRLVVRILETYYGCNIFMYIRNESNRHGEILLPFYSNVYIYRRYDRTTPTVILVLSETEGEVYPYQCEIVSFGDDLLHSERFVTRNEKLTEVLSSTIYESISSYDLRTQKRIEPQEIDPGGIVSQYIDSIGKRRANLYMMQNESILSIVVDPSIPLNVPSVRITDLTPVSISDATEFVEKRTARNVSIAFQDIRNNRVVGLVLTDGRYIIVTGDRLPDIPVSDKYSNPLQVISKRTTMLSYLKNMRKLATILKFHTLRLYALDPTGFGSSSFEIIKDYSYANVNFKSRSVLEKGLYTNDRKLVVTSDTILRKLLYYVKTMELSNREYVMKHATMKIVDTFYTTIDDFESREHQLVFDNTKSFMSWLYKERTKESDASIYYVPRVRSSEPTVVRNPAIFGGKPFIIQNVIDGELGRAIRVASIWISDNVNTGYHSSSLADKEVPYEVYDVNGIVKRNEGAIPLYVHEDGTYAAILRI